MDKVKDGEKEISVHGMRTHNLRFTDDIDKITEDKSTMEKTVHLLQKKTMKYGLVMNANETKTMVFGDKQISSKICIKEIELKDEEKFTYLGSNMTYDLDCSKVIAVRIAKTMANLKALDKIWKSKAITLQLAETLLQKVI